ncbi:MAG: hypothetical protein PHS68_07515 [Candidatus Izemoplasmatales bacterium]|nr:hypothetical protein [Candidatus Izemoplasmatales bacterium]
MPSDNPHEEALIYIARQFNKCKFSELTRREYVIGDYLARRGFLDIPRLPRQDLQFVVSTNKEN